MVVISPNLQFHFHSRQTKECLPFKLVWLCNLPKPVSVSLPGGSISEFIHESAHSFHPVMMVGGNPAGASVSLCEWRSHGAQLLANMWWTCSMCEQIHPFCFKPLDFWNCLLCGMTLPVLTDTLRKEGIMIAVISFLHNKELRYRELENLAQCQIARKIQMENSSPCPSHSKPCASLSHSHSWECSLCNKQARLVESMACSVAGVSSVWATYVNAHCECQVHFHFKVSQV